MNDNNPLNIDDLFDDILKQESSEKKKLSILQQKEYARLNILHSINKDNIDEICDDLLGDKNNYFYAGKICGNRKIVNGVPIKKNSRIWYLCTCTCGEEIITRSDHLLTEYGTTGCIKCMKSSNAQRLIEISKNKEAQVGQIFGKRTVVEVIGRNGNNEFYVTCRCECGSIDKVRYAILKRGKRHACSKCTKRGPSKKQKETK